MIRDTLIKTKQILEDDGWIKGKFHGVGGHCLLGALGRADMPCRDYDVAVSIIDSCIDKRSLGIVWQGADAIISFNDMRQTTEKDVFNLLDCAIEKAETYA